PATLVQVPGQEQKRSQRARFVANGIQDDARPEARAPLADTPALRLEAPLGLRPADLFGGHALGNGVGHVKARDRLVEDLVGPVAEDPLRAGVPSNDVALGLEHDDAVVLDVVGDQAKSLRALAARSPAAGRHVGGASVGLGTNLSKSHSFGDNYIFGSARTY